MTDRIDRFVADLRRERPDLDPSHAEILGRIDRLALLHQTATLRDFRSMYGASATELDVLLALRLQGAPYQLSPTALANAVVATSGGMTLRIDRLEAAGLIERRPDPTDGRACLVTLTDSGRDLIDTSLPRIVDQEERLVGSLDANERRQLANLLRKLLASDAFHVHDPHWRTQSRQTTSQP